MTEPRKLEPTEAFVMMSEQLKCSVQYLHEADKIIIKETCKELYKLFSESKIKKVKKIIKKIKKIRLWRNAK